MDNKKIQTQRMKGYFIQATKEILKGEGLKDVSVRNIARQAGYSYATLYNYFRDAKDLVFECVKDFQQECQEFIETETKNSVRGRAKLQAMSEAYIKYFIQYPGIFELFFLEKTHDLAGKQPTVQLIATFLQRLTETEWNYCIQQNKLTEQQADVMKESLTYLVTGMLLLYITRRYPDSYKTFMESGKTQIASILQIG